VRHEHVTASVYKRYDIQDEAVNHHCNLRRHGRARRTPVSIRSVRPQGFSPAQANGAGGSTWKLGKVRRVLFGLPALAGQSTVYIAEGERDAFALRAMD
jgi:hypothetical protein